MMIEDMGESHDQETGRDAVGAYGLRLRGAGEGGSSFVSVPDTWPRLEIVREVAETEESEGYFEADAAQVVLEASGGVVTLERDPPRALFRLPTAFPDEALVHPYLAPAAAVHSVWLGRPSFHGGAVAVGGAAFGVLGERGQGKSSLLATLARAGCEVLTDDLLVLDGTTAFAGPRAIDLREDGHAALGVGEPLGRLGSRERWRVRLGPIAPALPLCGWITLAWGDEVSVLPIPPAQRIGILLRHASLTVVADAHPHTLLELAGLPAWQLVRPRSWDGVDRAAEAVLAAIATVQVGVAAPPN
jgi:hypothetical protein